MKCAQCLPYSLEFAQQITQATELEAMELAIALSDFSHLCADTANSIFTGVTGSIYGLVEMAIDPIGTAKNLGYCLGTVMNYVAEAMQYADSESFGWSCYSQILEQEHQYDAIYANAIIAQMQHWVINSSGQEKITLASRLLTDSVLYPRFTKLLSNAGNACCRVVAEIPEMKILEGFIDVYGEHKLAISLGDVGLNGMQDVGMSLMESEVAAARYGNVIKVRPFHGTLQELQKYGARCKLFQKELTACFDNLFYKQELLNFYKGFKNPLCFEVMHQGETVKLFWDLEHIMTYSLKFKPNKTTGLIEGFISGGHVGTYTKALEKAGEIIILAEQALPGGARMLEYQHKFGSFVSLKTEYPLSWTAEQIIQANIAVVQNFTHEKILKNGMIAYKGTKDGVEIVVILKKINEQTLKIASAFPFSNKLMSFS